MTRNVLVWSEGEVNVVVEQKVSSDCSLELRRIFMNEHEQATFVALVLLERNMISSD